MAGMAGIFNTLMDWKEENIKQNVDISNGCREWGNKRGRESKEYAKVDGVEVNEVDCESEVEIVKVREWGSEKREVGNENFINAKNVFIVCSALKFRATCASGSHGECLILSLHR